VTHCRPPQRAVMLYMECRPLPSLFDCGHGGVLCTFSNIPPPPAAGIARSSQLSSRWPGQAVQYVRPGGMARLACHSNVQTICLPASFLRLGSAVHQVGSISLWSFASYCTNHCRPTPFLQLGRAGHHGGSVLYGLWPSIVQTIAFPPLFTS
jgi:hypothetical protein